MSKKKALPKKHNPFKQAGFLGSLILIIYGYITVLTPNLNTFDSNGPKFLALAILNILVFGIFVYLPKYRQHFFKFFRSPIGIAYSLLMVFSLISFTKAINLSESILHFSKIFTTFTATWLVFVIVYENKYNLVPLAVAMSFLLLFDSFSVFSEISKYIKGDIKSLVQIKTVYSNKNILASSIFIKIAFPLWLMFFYEKLLKYLGIITVFFAFLAVLFMTARAFYLASFAFLILSIIYSVVRYFQTKQKQVLYNTGILLILFLISFGIFSFIEKTAYPKNSKRSVAERLQTISTKKESNLRIKIWGWSLNMFKNDPILGVGLGNWKLRVLEQENKTNPNYTYSYKSHNDFFENFCETGIFGGLSYIAIFAFILFYFASVLIKKPESGYLSWFFLVFFGMVGYFFDAFFNFPQDRPEIQALFALFFGAAIGIQLNQKDDNKTLETNKE